MVFRSQLFRKVTIIGVGLIGGSLGMALKKYKLAREVVGVSQRNASLVTALKNHAIDKTSTDAAKAVVNADLVVLATPVNTIINLLPKIAPHVRRNCIITDVGSTKLSIIDAANKHLSSPAFFLGSHPLTGSEKAGPTYANADLFQNALCVLTPTKDTNRLARDKVRQMWTKVGAKIKVLSPTEHDKILSYISHLPHILAYGLIETIPNEFLQYAAAGLKDSTRIAASSPQMWNDICMANSKNVVKSLDEFIQNASSIRKAIIAKNDRDLFDYFQRSKKKRDSLD